MYRHALETDTQSMQRIALVLADLSGWWGSRMRGETQGESLSGFTDPVDILVVDDDEVWARGTARLLEHNAEAFRVETATSLSGGQECYATTEYDCLVCDYQLGDGTGLMLLDTVREDDPDCPFILVTGRGDEHVASEAIRRGTTEYIVKHDDDDAELLTTRVANAVHSARTRRALERERRSKDAILELLRVTTDELSLCQEFCSLLVETHGYDCAWVGTDREGGQLVIEASAGTDGFLDEAVHDQQESGDPALAALEAGEPVIRSPPTAREPPAEETAWQRLASEHGFETAAGVPIRHDGVRFGVLGVYATERPTIDENGLHLLSEFADSLGYALHTAEVKRSLLSNQPVAVEFGLTDPSIPLVSLQHTLPEDCRLTVPSCVLREEKETICLTQIENAAQSVVTSAVTATDRVSFTDEDETVRDLGRDQPLQCGLLVRGETPESLVATHGASVTETVVEDGRCRLRVQLPDHSAIGALETSLDEAYTDAAVTSIRQDRQSAATERVDQLLDPLTAKQETAIRHAYYQGFFEHPRSATATEIAEHFGVTRQTLTHHLRAAERKIFDQVFES